MTVEFDNRARRELCKLDQPVQHEVLRYLRERIATEDDPRRFGKALVGDLGGLCRYRVGDCRIICLIEDDHLVVLVVRIARRSTVYDR